MDNREKYKRKAIEVFGKNYIKNSNVELIFPCPKCAKNKTNKLYVSLTTGLYHCFRCDYKGKLRIGYSFSDVITPSNKNKLNHLNKKNDKQVYLLPFSHIDLTEEQRVALYNRGLTDEEIKYYNIYGGKRIQIPNEIFGCLTDIVCMWEWRKDRISNTNPKYLYSSEVNKSMSLFNIHNIDYNCNQIILCEGVFNAITAGKNAVASYGCSLSEQQLNLLLDKQPKTIVIAYDSDIAGVKGAKNVIKMLKEHKYKGYVYYILLPRNKDINDLGRKRFKEYYNQNKIKIDLDSQISVDIPELVFNNKI